MKKIMFNDRFGLTEAVLSGRKTQTRRPVGEKIHDKWCDYEEYCRMAAPAGIPGAFCREKDFYLEYSYYKVGEVVAIAQSYADVSLDNFESFVKAGYTKMKAGWNNKMFVRAYLMPHHIRIMGVRIERLQDISDEDCIREGISPYYYGEEAEKIECGFAPDGFSFDGIDCHYPTPREAYAALIDKISGRGTWDSNPYVFVYDFELFD